MCVVSGAGAPDVRVSHHWPATLAEAALAEAALLHAGRPAVVTGGTAVDPANAAPPKTAAPERPRQRALAHAA